MPVMARHCITSAILHMLPAPMTARQHLMAAMAMKYAQRGKYIMLQAKGSASADLLPEYFDP